MAAISSESMFNFLAHVKKRPGMYNISGRMSSLNALESGFVSGYVQCCIDNGIKDEVDNSMWNDFLRNICDKYEISPPLYDKLIEKCGSDEAAYNAFMDELELFIKNNGIMITGT